jgi:hypothetical protein
VLARPGPCARLFSIDIDDGVRDGIDRVYRC